MSRRKSATCTTHVYGKTGSSSVDQSVQHYSTSRIGASPTYFVCTRKKAGIIRGGIIAREHFAATSACGSITSGSRRRWQRVVSLRASIKNRERGSALRITRQSLPSLTGPKKSV